MAELDDLKKLSPGERIRRLKELEEARKKEIEEAEKMITESEKEITIIEELKQVPIPEVKAPDISHLFGSPDEKAIFKNRRFIDDTEEEPSPAQKPKSALEETVEQEGPKHQIVEKLRMYGELLESRGIRPDKAVAALAEAYAGVKHVREELEGGMRYDELPTEEKSLLRYTSNLVEQFEHVPMSYVEKSQFKDAVHGVFDNIEKIRGQYHR